MLVSLFLNNQTRARLCSEKAKGLATDYDFGGDVDVWIDVIADKDHFFIGALKGGVTDDAWRK